MPHQLYIAVLDNGPKYREVTYWKHLEQAIQWVADTLKAGGYRTIEHSSHIDGYVTTQGGYHSPAVVDPDSTIDGGCPPFITVTPIYHNPLTS